MLRFGDKVVGTVEVPFKLKEKDIETIIVDGLEGGINYWAGLNRKVNSSWLEDKPEGEPLSQWATKALIEGKEIILFDKEDPEEVFTLTLTKLISGFRQNYIEREWDNDLENGDAETVDSIIQYALFGKLVYG
jgi:hypothetical protein